MGPNMGNTDKNKSKKYRRKIRIRLKDPDIPDSYVCEIFDSSLENEEEESKNDGLKEKEDPSKPKNYFELLMSKECRKSHIINSVKENHVLKVVDGEESNQTTRRKYQENRKPMPQLVCAKREERKSESDSSDDETLLQIQRKSKLQNLDDSDDNETIYLAEDSAAKEDFKLNSDVIIEFESPKVELCQKKNFGILNYFSKKESNLKSRMNCDKLEEISVQNSLKTNCMSKNLKVVKKQDSEKAVQNEHKILNGINKENVKLAPLFYKKATKAIDSARQKARLEFLFKESPSVKKSENKNHESILTFPKVSHVQQRNENLCWSLREICLPLPEVQFSGEYVFNTNKVFNFKIETLDIMNYSVNNIQIRTNKDLFLKKKGKYLKLNLNLVIDGLKEKQEKFLSQAEELEKSSSVRNESTGSETGFEELNSLWTDKYKPRSSEILGNDNVVKKLKKWLQSWKSFDEELKVLVKSNRSSKSNKESDDGSDDDFLDSNGQNYGLKAPCNVCIISGPNGCGKTALVYALAGELEFSVLELNASSKRTGKKVLTDLQEATQSHKVQRVNLVQTEMLQKEIKKKKNHKKKKSNKIEKPGTVLEQTNDCKISLILIEDADIVYEEHDEGFFGAITSLVQTSKRPLIFLTNEPNCHYLYNFKTEHCLVLEMEPPNLYSSCAILDIVSALEGANLEPEFLDSFVRQNNYDLRRSLLQLQFWMHSKKSSDEKLFDLGRLWWGLSTFLFKQDIRHFVKSKGRKRKRVSDLFDSSDDELESVTKKHKSNSSDSINSSAFSANEINKKSNVCIESYFRVLDLVSTLDSFCLPGSQEPIPGSQCKPKDSLSLEENMEDAPWIGKSMAEEISRELISLSTRVFAEELKEKNAEDRKLNFVSPCWEEIRWRKAREKASEELSLLVSLQRGRDTRSLHLDYLPLLRNMCRTERNRSEMNPKRRNRFYHYLNNLGPELTDENLEINCDVLERR